MGICGVPQVVEPLLLATESFRTQVCLYLTPLVLKNVPFGTQTLLYFIGLDIELFGFRNSLTVLWRLLCKQLMSLCPISPQLAHLGMNLLCLTNWLVVCEVSLSNPSPFLLFAKSWFPNSILNDFSPVENFWIINSSSLTLDCRRLFSFNSLEQRLIEFFLFSPSILFRAKFSFSSSKNDRSSHYLNQRSSEGEILYLSILLSPVVLCCEQFCFIFCILFLWTLEDLRYKLWDLQFENSQLGDRVVAGFWA